MGVAFDLMFSSLCPGETEASFEVSREKAGRAWAPPPCSTALLVLVFKSGALAAYASVLSAVLLGDAEMKGDGAGGAYFRETFIFCVHAGGGGP